MADPDFAVRILEQTRDAAVRQPLGIGGIKHLEPFPIELRNAIVGGGPEVTGPGLEQRGDAVLRHPPLGHPGFDGELGRGLVRRPPALRCGTESQEDEDGPGNRSQPASEIRRHVDNPFVAQPPRSIKPARPGTDDRFSDGR